MGPNTYSQGIWKTRVVSVPQNANIWNLNTKAILEMNKRNIIFLLADPSLYKKTKSFFPFLFFGAGGFVYVFFSAQLLILSFVWGGSQLGAAVGVVVIFVCRFPDSSPPKNHNHRSCSPPLFAVAQCFFAVSWHTLGMLPYTRTAPL